MTDAKRIRWQCRRGLLELDLILERFTRQHLDRLDPGQLQCFEELLAYSDSDLLELVRGRAAFPKPRHQELLQLLRTA